MATYAILGATGNTGGSLLEILSLDAGNKIHALVRSTAKLETQKPGIIAKEHVRIFEGSVSNVDVLTACLTGSQAVFLTAATTENQPGCTIAQDTAKAVITALESIKTSNARAKLPRLIMLSTASMEPELCRDQPRLVIWFMHKSTSYIIDDLRLAETYLRAEAKRLQVEVTFIKPGGLAHDSAKGHELSTERQQTFLSFLDLAAGMIEVATEKDDKWNGMNVSVLPREKTRIEWRNGSVLLRGILFHYFPRMYSYFGA